MVNPDKKIIRKTGTVLEALPSTHFKVRLDDGKEIMAHLAGKLRMFRIKVLPGDKVQVEMSSYDESRGRIVYRGISR
ncbi:MAG: translation initiation factor IF-1 [Candidatus Nealsonbacteria bacterium CG09_land_8_20_14_0_10_42_14]|uniref:Translation initiation factor IF-1 n=1 Tax=Candidatus Nealsonbacteria bacterium CG09_land_8_20_14_0_10_42_14 TaxID=1974707 RepID=A0A2H0WXE7_9BACT|nr:MAG: translation initiation factor IF-1 [Candidatus Nealsonbacteria bacterium CG09_land_8_20_14_0_10_42_14]